MSPSSPGALSWVRGSLLSLHTNLQLLSPVSIPASLPQPILTLASKLHIPRGYRLSLMPCVSIAPQPRRDTGQGPEQSEIHLFFQNHSSKKSSFGGHVVRLWGNTKFHVTLVGLRLTMWPNIILNSCLHHLSAGITGKYHHAQFYLFSLRWVLVVQTSLEFL